MWRAFLGELDERGRALSIQEAMVVERTIAWLAALRHLVVRCEAGAVECRSTLRPAL